MSYPHIVATDMDGTILPFDGELRPRVRAALLRAHEKGARIVFATGRPPRWMQVVRDIPGAHLAICGNGAVVVDLRDFQVVKSWLIPPTTAADVVQRLRSLLPKASFAVESLDGYHRESDYNPRWDLGVDLYGVSLIEEKLEDDLIKVLVRSPNELISADEMLAIASKELEGIAQVTHSALPDDALLEISALGVTKGSALAYLAAEWGLHADNAVAFGDNRNDVAMLKWAGRSWAMSNAHPSAIEAASDICATVEEDGVAVVLEELFA
jgi:Cof subfamily protein (haloacid dehalogenase superfamily)